MGIPFARVRAVPKIWVQLLSCLLSLTGKMYPNNNETGTQSKKPISTLCSFKTINQTPNSIMIGKKIHIIYSLILLSNFNFFLLLNYPQSSYLYPNHSSKDLPCVFF